MKKTTTILIAILCFAHTSFASKNLTVSKTEIQPKNTKCPTILKQIPYSYNVKEKTFNPPNATLLEITNSDDELLKLVKPCQCLDQIAKQNVFGPEVGEFKKSDWAKRFLPDACKRIQQTNSTQINGASTTSSQFCTISTPDLTIENKTILLTLFKAIDQHPVDCQLNSNREKCLLKREQARIFCQSGQAPNTQIEGVPNFVCKEIDQMQCIRDSATPEKIDFDQGFDSESFNVNSVLKTEGQTGFTNIEDQGAGSNNPAINFILYIINLLTNLSFLISVLMLIMAGFYSVIASGNEEMNNKSKAAIKYFIMAITFTLLSYTIVIIIRSVLYS